MKKNSPPFRVRKHFVSSVLFLAVYTLTFGCISLETLSAEDAVRVPASSEEILADWLLQDLAFDPAKGQRPITPDSKAQTVFTDSAPNSAQAETERALVLKVLDETNALAKAASNADAQQKCDALRKELAGLEGTAGTDGRWKELYVKSASLRRSLRLAPLRKNAPKFIFTKHPNLGGSHYAYTEAVSDAQAERSFRPGSQLCMMELNESGEYVEKVLIDDPRGMIRDPDITYDGKAVVFAWKKSDLLDDFHLYRMDLETKEIKQLTFGLGWADYEPCCLPSGDIIFNSTRCSQIVDCWWTEVSNLYRIDADGQFLRRMSFDQVHDNYPTLTLDGRVIYTRWDYNDRGQIYPQGLFQMNPDGTGQTALYGNNSWFPTTILHARPIPETNGQLICVFSGHHNWQRGKLGVLDPNKGREEAEGATLAAPYRKTLPERIDAYGQEGEQFCYPVPVSRDAFLVAYRPNAEKKDQKQERLDPFSIYLMDFDGKRELLVMDGDKSCNQTAFRAMKPAIQERPSMVDPSQTTGVYYLQDVFYGPGLEGVDRSKVRSIRVVEIGFRTVGIGHNGNHGPAGGAMSSTPISIGGGAWDTKKVLGEAKIYEDGSACFRVPAKTPLYFQVIDDNGHVVQTMRSWSTLQPGETFSCIGCHEDKNSIAARGSSSMAMKAGPQELTPFHGPARWFSFTKEIQPILDKHCIKCHDNSEALPPYASAGESSLRIPMEHFTPIFPIENTWSHVTKVPAEGWTTRHPIQEGAKEAKGPFGHIPDLKKSGSPWANDSNGIWMTSVLDLPADYQPKALYANVFYDDDIQVFINGQKVFFAQGFVKNYQMRYVGTNPLKPGRNVIAVYCLYNGGGRGVDLGLYELKETEEAKTNAAKTRPFSLLSKGWHDTGAKRYWSESYMNLTNSPYVERARAQKSNVVTWINIQNSPTMLKPYDSGAAFSSICTMFDGPNPHNGVQLSQKEKDLIACWIDLLVPFCATYEEASAWEEAEWKRHAYYHAKKDFSDELDRKNYEAWAKSQPVPVITGSENPYRDLVPTAKRTDTTDSVTFEFAEPVRTDWMNLTLQGDVKENAEYEIRLDGHTEKCTLTPQQRTVWVGKDVRTVSKITITGKPELLEKVEILGVSGAF